MAPPDAAASSIKREFYRELIGQAEALLDRETDALANAANFAALLYHSLPDINWAGFYFYRGGELVVGPFQGKPACVRIAMGKGVCGTAAQRRTPIVVPDVNAFPGHIACDSASRSEIVIPLVEADRLLGVLDLDSPTPARFDQEDQSGLEGLASAFLERTDLRHWPA
jgi:L-methionine (R)-S-oxide reductase